MPEKTAQFFANLQKQMEGGAVQPEELVRVAKIIVEVVKGITDELRSDVEKAKEEVTGSNGSFAAKLEETNAGLADLLSRHYQIETSIKSLGKNAPKVAIDTSNAYTDKQITAINKALLEEINAIKDLIEGPTDVSGIMYRLDQLETVGESAELIRNKLELLKDEDRLDASAIKNLPEATEKVVERVVAHSSLWTLADVSTVGATDGQVLTYKAANNSWYPANGGGGGGSGTVTTVSVATANGFAGTVTNPTTTPAITIRTTVTGILKGNGTSISAATAGTDYQAPITLTTTGSSGAATFIGNTLNIPQYAGTTYQPLHYISALSSQSASFSAVANNKYTVDATGGVVTATLPATNTIGDILFIQKSDSTVNVVNLSGTINGTAASTLPLRLQLQGKMLQADGTGNWNVIAGDLSLPSLDARYQAAGTYVTSAAGSTNQIQYNNGGAFAANANFVWDITNGRLGVGTATPNSLLDTSGSDAGTTITSASVAMHQITNTNTTAGNFSDLTFSTFDLSSANVVSSKIVGVHTSHTAGAVSGDLSFMTRNAGTLSEAMRLTAANSVYITSNNALAFAVGLNGATNSAFSVDASTASSATGLVIKSAATGGTTALTATDSGANASLQINAKGNGSVYINGTSSGVAGISNGGTGKLFASSTGTTSTNQTHQWFANFNNNASQAKWEYLNNQADTALSAGTEATAYKINLSAANRTHGSNSTIATQRSIRFIGSNHFFATAGGTITNLATFSVDASVINNNGTATNVHNIYIPSFSVVGGTGTATNSYGITVNAQAGATNNYAAQFVGATVMNGAQLVKRTTVADIAYTVLISDYLVAYTSLTAARAVTLPAPTAAQANQIFIIKDEAGTAGTNNLTITPTSGTIDGAASKTINANYGTLKVYHNGTNYFTTP